MKNKKIIYLRVVELHFQRQSINMLPCVFIHCRNSYFSLHKRIYGLSRLLHVWKFTNSWLCTTLVRGNSYSSINRNIEGQLNFSSLKDNFLFRPMPNRSYTPFFMALECSRPTWPFFGLLALPTNNWKLMLIEWAQKLWKCKSSFQGRF